MPPLLRLAVLVWLSLAAVLYAIVRMTRRALRPPPRTHSPWDPS